MPREKNNLVANRQIIRHLVYVCGMEFSICRTKFRHFLPLVLVHILLHAIAIVPLQAQSDHTTDSSHLKNYTISQETTYITEPLQKDGSVDYITALNQRFSDGITPENNAAVLFWKAVGPEEIFPVHRNKYFQMLGMPPLPEKADYFVDLDNYIAREENSTTAKNDTQEAGTQDNTLNHLDLAVERPWSKQEFPVLAQWIAANEKPLALVLKASKLPRRFDPLCCGQRTPLLAVALPAFFHYNKIAYALRARAMLRLNEGFLEEAWQDLLACHRLARLAGQGPTVIEVYSAYAIEEKTCVTERALLQYSHLTAAQAVKILKDLNQLSPMPKMVDNLDVAERFAYLSSVHVLSRDGMASLVGYEDVFGKEFANIIKSIIRYSTSTKIDWDLILRMGNSWFDRTSDAYSKPTRSEQREALSKLEDDFRRLKKTAADVKTLDKAMLVNPHTALSERLSHVLLSVFFPDIMLCTHFEDRVTMRLELDKLSFALAAYRDDHGKYPAKLTELASNYVTEVPKDIFNDFELHYRAEGKGYLLYSVGFNGKDDGSKSYGDCKNEEGWDDLVVRMPAPEQK